jgi:hypothetical protein
MGFNPRTRTFFPLSKHTRSHPTRRCRQYMWTAQKINPAEKEANTWKRLLRADPILFLYYCDYQAGRSIYTCCHEKYSLTSKHRYWRKYIYLSPSTLDYLEEMVESSNIPRVGEQSIQQYGLPWASHTFNHANHSCELEFVWIQSNQTKESSFLSTKSQHIPQSNPKPRIKHNPLAGRALKAQVLVRTWRESILHCIILNPAIALFLTRPLHCSHRTYGPLALHWRHRSSFENFTISHIPRQETGSLGKCECSVHILGQYSTYYLKLTMKPRRCYCST